MNIFVAILALSFLIIVHEFGHFIVAKLSGIKVLEFSLFMGPKLFSLKRGETTYSIRSIPLGGYVKMEGEEQESSDDRAYNRKPVYIRAAVIAAGPIMNLIVAVIFLTIITSVAGYRTTNIRYVEENSPAYNAGIREGDRVLTYNGKKILHPMDVELFKFGNKGKPVGIEFERNGIKQKAEITPEIFKENRFLLGFSPMSYYNDKSNIVRADSVDSKNQKVLFRKGDKIVRLGSQEISSGRDIRKFLGQNGDKPINVEVIRNGKTETFTVIPTKSNAPEQYEIGLDFSGEKGNILNSLKHSAIYSVSLSRNIYYSLAWLVTGNVSMKQMSGPVGIVSTIGDIVEMSPTLADRILGLMQITAFISINLGLFNLIPFPALDGSKLVILAIEGIRRKAIPPEREAFISLIGLALLIMLMIYATYNDIVRLAGGG
ncbi:MAG: RIP metalloprotease RseP [Clostridia bacterium]|nr:RIP metalloprotease RseP [Clostridia bacterium]